jgi:hypothetical protein
MPGLVPGIHAEPRTAKPKIVLELHRVDGRDKPGHDDLRLRSPRNFPFFDRLTP